MKPIFTARFALLALSLVIVAACGQEPPESAFFTRGSPESLLDVSSEVVNLSIASKANRKDLSQWIAKDQPIRAELNCTTGKDCTEAEKILDLHGVPVVHGNGMEQSVTLIYQRILARDCNQRYIDNPSNYYNTNHSAFGCSISANMVQAVTNKQEFVSPNLSDDPSAVRGVGVIQRAYTLPPTPKPYGISDSAVAQSKNGG